MDANAPQPCREGRKEYHTPQLRKLGALADLTWSGTGGAADGGMPMA